MILINVPDRRSAVTARQRTTSDCPAPGHEKAVHERCTLMKQKIAVVKSRNTKTRLSFLTTFAASRAFSACSLLFVALMVAAVRESLVLAEVAGASPVEQGTLHIVNNRGAAIWVSFSGPSIDWGSGCEASGYPGTVSSTPPSNAKTYCAKTGDVAFNLPVQLSCSREPTYICRGPLSKEGPGGITDGEAYPKNCGNPNATCACGSPGCPAFPHCVAAYFYPMFSPPENAYQPNAACPNEQILTITFTPRQ
jgi:hypothetical protein